MKVYKDHCFILGQKGKQRNNKCMENEVEQKMRLTGNELTLTMISPSLLCPFHLFPLTVQLKHKRLGLPLL